MSPCYPQTQSLQGGTLPSLYLTSHSPLRHHLIIDHYWNHVDFPDTPFFRVLNVCVFFSATSFYLLEKLRDRIKKLLHPLIDSPSAHSCQGWARIQSLQFSLGLPYGSQVLTHVCHFNYFCISERTWGSWNLEQRWDLHIGPFFESCHCLTHIFRSVPLSSLGNVLRFFVIVVGFYSCSTDGTNLHYVASLVYYSCWVHRISL